jgi:uncharacterized lipoprotein YmbA
MNSSHETNPDRRITDTDAEIIATHMVNKLVDRLSDEQTVQMISGVWAKQLDQHIGRTVRRALWLVLVTISVVVAAKIDAIVAWLRSA